MANVCCSIEMEPRTLKEGQLSYAREVAADVVQKMEPKEASKIFIEKGDGGIGIKGKEKMIEIEIKKGPIIERPCQCVCTAEVSESPEQIKLEEPLSAPI